DPAIDLVEETRVSWRPDVAVATRELRSRQVVGQADNRGHDVVLGKPAGEPPLKTPCRLTGCGRHFTEERPGAIGGEIGKREPARPSRVIHLLGQSYGVGDRRSGKCGDDCGHGEMLCEVVT